jgi:hypothetical protein
LACMAHKVHLVGKGYGHPSDLRSMKASAL